MTKNNKLKYIVNIKFLTFLLLFLIMLTFLLNSSTYISSFVSGLNVWAFRLVPTLLPFTILTKLMIQTSIPNKIGAFITPVTSKIYNTSGCSGYVFALSALSGYPMNAKILCDLYKCGNIDEGQAKQITSFTSVTGPVFIISTVAVGMFDSLKIGIIILISHLIGALLNGLLYKNSNQELTPTHIFIQNTSISDIVVDSVNTLLVIGGYVAMFFMLSTMLNNMPLFTKLIELISKLTHIDYNIIKSVINGSIEMTRGCMELSQCGLSSKSLTILATGIISFGGISTLMQAYTFTCKYNLKFGNYIKIKLTQTILSIIVAFALCIFV